MYDESMVAPMRQELTQVGFKEAKTSEEVDQIVAEAPQSVLMYVNSVCGCAAGIARPGLVDSLNSEIKPTVLVTAFAGNDASGVNRMRELFVGYAPSSPCAGLFRDGKLVHMIERHQIEGQSAENLSKMLTSAYTKYCGTEVNAEAEIFDPIRAVQILPHELAQKISTVEDLAILDVREEFETEQGIIENSVLVNNDVANDIVNNWKRDREIVVYCAHGSRSLQALQFLKQQGFNNVSSLTGGYAGWTSFQED